MKHVPLSARRFLKEFWQKKPLLLRNALPQVAGLVDRAYLIGLACRSDVESRLVIGTRRRWRVDHGPFQRRDLARLPARDWSLLVNGVENVLPAARDVQQAFSFVSYARQDDVMISYAAPGGSVGPHFDSYDVFLLQGAGVRRWQVSAQRDLALVEGAPLRLLEKFRPQHAWTLRSGDLLYLPPRYAHHGIASSDCITWSIGCRAPTQQELATRFLDDVQDRLHLEGLYRDPQLTPTRHPAAISRRMIEHAHAAIRAVRWNGTDVARGLGEYLSEPRANVVFERPKRISADRFRRAAAQRGLRLALKTRMLYAGQMVFINGECVVVEKAAARALLALADGRELRPGSYGARAGALLYRWYCDGYIELAAGARENKSGSTAIPLAC